MRVSIPADTKGFQAFDQQTLVLVLRKYFEERVGRQPFAHPAQRQARYRFALDPEVGRRHAMTALYHGVDKVELAVQLQRPRLHRQRPGCGAGCRCLVENPHADPQFAQPQCEHQPGRTGADDQYIATVHAPVLPGRLAQVWFRRGGPPDGLPNGKGPPAVEWNPRVEPVQGTVCRQYSHSLRHGIDRMVTPAQRI